MTRLDDVTRRSQERRIAAAINRRVESGRPFVVEHIWPRFGDINPGDHRSWVGQMMQQLSQSGRIEHVGWSNTDGGRKHSRAVRTWRGVPRHERVAS